MEMFSIIYFRKAAFIVLLIALVTGCSDSSTPPSNAVDNVSTSGSQSNSSVNDSVGQAQAGNVASQQISTEADLVIKGGQLLDMVGNQANILPIKGMVVRGGKIDRIIEKSSSESLPKAKKIIDASSEYILPGLIDSHVHFRPWTPSAAIFRRGNLHFGVTGMIDFSPCGNNCKVADSTEWILAYRDLLNNSANLKGPSLYITGRKLSGPDARDQAHAHILKNTDEIGPYIDYLAGLDVDLIYVEDGFPQEYRKLVVKEAKKRGLPVIGGSVDARETISTGMKFIEHMYPIVHSLADEPQPEDMLSPDFDYLMDMERVPEFINLMVENDIHLNPTMTSRYGKLSQRAENFMREDENLFEFGGLFSDAPEKIRPRVLAAYESDDIDSDDLDKMQEGYKKIQSFLKQFSEAGGKIMVGTDSTDSKMPGVTVHREMLMLEDIGIEPYRILLGATRWAAEMMYKDENIGTLEEGKLADILILGSNPLEQMANSRDIQFVIHNGVIHRSADDCSVIEPPISQTCW